jgi:hypothetical protein
MDYYIGALTDVNILAYPACHSESLLEMIKNLDEILRSNFSLRMTGCEVYPQRRVLNPPCIPYNRAVIIDSVTEGAR